MHQLVTTSLALFSFFMLSEGVVAQSFLPPLPEWKGKSESLITTPSDPWITPVEKSGFVETPPYAETIAWLDRLCKASPYLKKISIGKSPEGRDIWMVIASTDADKSVAALRKSPKPLLLAQAGIHSGEIDGKDAGMMLLRDLAVKGKTALIQNVNLLFIPILNVDGHERSSPYNRPNQRGPANMGWRTNAQNLNLNRDYTKLDTREIRAVIGVINEYDPDLYMDIHVTDGADYQYDITYDAVDENGHSPSISRWLKSVYVPAINRDLKALGHVPGPFLNATNWRDFKDGNTYSIAGPNFSNSYGDLRHLPTLIIETHSLKPYKQRVLGTYTLLEATLKLLAVNGKSLQESIRTDKARRDLQIPIAWKKNEKVDSMLLLGIRSEVRKSALTGGEHVAWLGQPETTKIPFYKITQPSQFLSRPKGYWIPVYCKEVLERLKAHGIQMESLKNATETELEMYRIHDPVFAQKPFEGHIMVSGKPKPEIQKRKLPEGSVWVSTDQPLGDLAMVLLEPYAPESFLQWGFFHAIFQRTEYGEDYFLEPMAQQMLADSPSLKAEFESKKQSDTAFVKSPDAILHWFYEKSPYYDPNYLLYPIGRIVK